MGKLLNLSVTQFPHKVAASTEHSVSTMLEPCVHTVGIEEFWLLASRAVPGATHPDRKFSLMFRRVFFFFK